MRKIINVRKLLLLLFFPFAVVGCRHDENENKDAKNDTSNVEIVQDVDTDFDVKEILSNYSVSPKQEEAIIKIMDDVDYYLKINIDEILKESLKKKKRAKNLDKVFLHGKVSAKSLEFYINDKIEEYNDDHLIDDRLHNVTLEIVADTMAISPIYNELLVKDWMKVVFLRFYTIPFNWIEKGRMNSEKRTLIRDDMMNAYYALFKAENLIEQMIGVENKEISRQ